MNQNIVDDVEAILFECEWFSRIPSLGPFEQGVIDHAVQE